MEHQSGWLKYISLVNIIKQLFQSGPFWLTWNKFPFWFFIKTHSTSDRFACKFGGVHISVWSKCCSREKSHIIAGKFSKPHLCFSLLIDLWLLPVVMIESYLHSSFTSETSKPTVVFFLFYQLSVHKDSLPRTKRVSRIMCAWSDLNYVFVLLLFYGKHSHFLDLLRTTLTPFKFFRITSFTLQQQQQHFFHVAHVRSWNYCTP